MTSSPPSTVTRRAVSGWRAGLSGVGSPVATANRLLWHGHTMKPSCTDDTAQPWCGHRVEKALNWPWVGWVTTTLRVGEDRTAADRHLVGRADGPGGERTC